MFITNFIFKDIINLRRHGVDIEISKGWSKYIFIIVQACTAVWSEINLFLNFLEYSIQTHIKNQYKYFALCWYLFYGYDPAKTVRA